MSCGQISKQPLQISQKSKNYDDKLCFEWVIDIRMLQHLEFMRDMERTQIFAVDSLSSNVDSTFDELAAH